MSMISEKQYLLACELIKKYRQQKAKAKIGKIVPEDIDLYWQGFSCKKITSLTDVQLNEISDQIQNKIATIFFVNVEEYQFLNVSYNQKCSTTFKEVKTICKILNKILK